MGLFTKDIKTMDDLFVHTLRDIYYAENQIVKALPEMIEKAGDPMLRKGFEGHLDANGAIGIAEAEFAALVFDEFLCELPLIFAVVAPAV